MEAQARGAQRRHGARCLEDHNTLTTSRANGLCRHLAMAASTRARSWLMRTAFLQRGDEHERDTRLLDLGVQLTSPIKIVDPTSMAFRKILTPRAQEVWNDEATLGP